MQPNALLIWQNFIITESGCYRLPLASASVVSGLGTTDEPGLQEEVIRALKAARATLAKRELGRGYRKWRWRVSLHWPWLVGRLRVSLGGLPFWRSSLGIRTRLKTRPRRKSRVCLTGQPASTDNGRKLRGNAGNWSSTLPFCKPGF
jgi:hypothetical protein